MFRFLFGNKRPVSPARSSFRSSFRPQLEILEGRMLPSSFGPVSHDLAPQALFQSPAQGPIQIQSIQVRQVTNQMQINSIPVFSNASAALAALEKTAQHVNVQNGVADITEAAKAPVESLLLDRLPRTMGNYPFSAEVTLDRLTLDGDGNFNGQLTVAFKAGPMSGTITATITDNQLSLSSDNAMVRQFGKLDQRQSEWQPKVTEVLDVLRDRPEFHDVMVLIRQTAI
jgi:hypothetical protein